MERQRLTAIGYLSDFQYLDDTLDFIQTSEGYVKAVKVGNTTEYHYVYHYKDHLGNIRLSYGRDPETNEVAILKESHYYPFGLEHQGYVSNHKMFEAIPIGEPRASLLPVRNYLDDSYRYTFGGKEAQPELGLNWLDFHARNYDAALGRWMNVDPLAEKYLSWSPYNYTMNNPINMIDPTGMAAEWIPKVNNDGSISYIAEDGDNASTLKSQYGLDKNIAEDLYSTMEEGEITGESVANITESEVLTLDLKSDLASDQRVFDQFMFAMDHSQSQNKSGFYTTEYFSNVFNQNSRFREGFANLNINGRNIKVNYQLPLYETQGVIFNVNLFPYFLSNTTETSYIRYGNMFGNNYESISHQFLPLSLSFGKGLKNLKSQGYYRISTSSQNDRLLNHRLNNK